MTPSLIPVLGMHRSGTSVLTRGLMSLNINLGTNLMDPMENNNPKGFWEDLDIYSLNERMLEYIGSTWYDDTIISNSNINALIAAATVNAQHILNTKLQDGEPFGFKDPRLCRLVNFWKHVANSLNKSTGYVIAVRNPASVADSLYARNGLSRTHSYIMWLVHTLSAIVNTNDDTRIMVQYENLLNNPSKEIHNIAETFELITNEEQLTEYCDSFIETSLCHSWTSIGTLMADPECPQLVIDCYHALTSTTSPLDNKDVFLQLWDILHKEEFL